MGRKKRNKSFFSSENQPNKKRKEQREFDNSSNRELNSVGVQTKDFENSKKAFIDAAEKIDKLSRDCTSLKAENSTLKRTVKTLRKSIGEG